MANWDLSEIRTKARQLSGRLSLSDMGNTQLDEYINKYVQYEFPAEVKLNRNYTLHQFNTTANTERYSFPTGFTNFVPEATIDRMPLNFYQSPDQWYDLVPEQVSRFTTWTGDGATVAFSNTYSNNVPIQPGSVYVDDTVEVFTDDGAGTLTGDQGGSGSVNYSTGLISATFATAPADEQSIQTSFITLTTGRPTDVLMFNNQFIFYPTPDKAYRFQIKAWSLATVTDGTNTAQLFTNATDRPLLDEWGPAIAFGAARRIVSDFGEMDRYAELTALYKEQISYILARTYIDLESTRAAPIF